MTVYDLTNLFIEDIQMVEICSLCKQEEQIVYKGEICNIPYELENEEIMSIDSFYGYVDHLTINIE